MPKPLQIVGLIVAILSLAPICNAADVTSIPWETHFDKAYKANADNRPMLVFLSIKGCYHCKRMEKTTFVDPQVVKAVNARYIPVAIDGDDYPTLVKHLGITSYPTTLIINSQLKVLSASRGYLDATKLHAQLTKQAAATIASKPDSDLR